MLAQKELSFAGLSFVIFLKVFNLLDRLNEVAVYSDTGRSTYTLAIARGEGAAIDRRVGLVDGVHSMSEYFANPTLYAAPREVLVGITLNF